MVGILVSFWDGLLSGAVLVLGRVEFAQNVSLRSCWFMGRNQCSEVKICLANLSQMVPFKWWGGIWCFVDAFSSRGTLPKTNSSHLKMVVSNRNLLFQGSIFRCYVSFREGTLILGIPHVISVQRDPGWWIFLLSRLWPVPIGYMYGIFTYIYHTNQPFM